MSVILVATECQLQEEASDNTWIPALSTLEMWSELHLSNNYRQQHSELINSIHTVLF